MSAYEQETRRDHPVLLAPDPATARGARYLVTYRKVPVHDDIGWNPVPLCAERKVKVFVVRDEPLVETAELQPCRDRHKQDAAAEHINRSPGSELLPLSEEWQQDGLLPARKPHRVRIVVPVNQRAHEGIGKFSRRLQPCTDEPRVEGGVIVEKQQVGGALGEGDSRRRIADGCKTRVWPADISHEGERVYFGGRRVGRPIVGKDDTEVFAFLLGEHPQAISGVGPIAKHGHDDEKTDLRRLGWSDRGQPYPNSVIGRVDIHSGDHNLPQGVGP